MKSINWWQTTLKDAEIEAVVHAMRDRRIGMGPLVVAFESEICKALDVPYALMCPSGSVALYMALMVHGIGPGDEVIVPNRTFIATAHAARLTGARVVLVDCNAQNTNINVDLIEEKITPKTRAIMPVHLNGRAVSMDALTPLARRHRLIVVEDACQALFSQTQGKPLGTLSHVGCFSLGIAKLLTTGIGGFAVCHDQKTWEQLARFRNHGVSDLNHLDYQSLGFNFKVSDMTAAAGRVQLARREQRAAHVTRIYHTYVTELAGIDGITPISVNTQGGEIPIYAEFRSPRRDALLAWLEGQGIAQHLLPPGLHLSAHLENDGLFPNSDGFDREAFILPCGPDQPLENIHVVVEKVKEFFAGQFMK
ncbi:MAG: DegT/DnrJ/EryC1/StrS family aminotransferase [Nitrospirae bacterium]|nr:DegT/DnrJ/EryC1/StrS family aminotransferase [Magnetococcales bacterium]